MNVPQAAYDIESFCGAILDTPDDRLFEGLHVHQVKVFLYLTSVDEWRNLFGAYETEDYGDVLKFSSEYQTRVGDTEEANFYAASYGSEDDVLMIFTGATEDAISQTLEETESGYTGIEPMPIFPTDFQKMNEYILSENPDMEISEFKAVSHPELAKADIRPEFDDREIIYKADDGRKALGEFREYYGVVPVRIQYFHHDLQFKMDTDGKFTLATINEDTFNLFFELIERVVEEIKDVQEVSEKIRFRTKTRQSGDLEVEVPRMDSGQITFDKEFNLTMAEHFIEHVSSQGKRPFTFSDVNKQAGSLDLSARVTDEARNSHFNISSTEDAMTIVPKHNCSWGSILKFYHFFTQAVDEQAGLEPFGRSEGPQAK